MVKNVLVSRLYDMWKSFKFQNILGVVDANVIFTSSLSNISLMCWEGGRK